MNSAPTSAPAPLDVDVLIARIKAAAASEEAAQAQPANSAPSAATAERPAINAATAASPANMANMATPAMPEQPATNRWLGNALALPAAPAPLELPLLASTLGSAAAAAAAQPYSAQPYSAQPYSDQPPAGQRQSALPDADQPHAQSGRLSLGNLLSPISHRDFLARAYQALLGRDPDPEGASGYSAYLNRGGSRLRVLYTLRQSPEGKARSQSLDVAPWHWLYRLTPVKRLIGPWLGCAERRYLRHNPEYAAREATRVLAQALDQRHLTLAQWTRDLSAATQQRDQALETAQTRANHQLSQQQQALSSLQQQGEHWGGAIEELRRDGEQQGALLEHLRGDTRNLADRANAVETAVAELRGGAEWLQRQIDELKESLERIDASAADAQSAIGTEVERRERLSKDLDFIRSDLIYHRGQAQALLDALRAAQEPPYSQRQPEEQAPPVQSTHKSPGLPSDDRLDAYYVAFEEEFRGSQEQIRATQEGYIADLRAANSVTAQAPLLDLGCGRGEWLALLAEHGLNAQGIDTNSVMVARCHQQGLQARCEDALAALQALPDAALGAVSAFHLIEHLPFSLLHDLLAHAHRALRPGGVLILETPNPENVLVGSHTFYHDPTHLNPMTPTATRFLVRYLGFTDPEIRRLHPYPESAKVPGHDPLTERVNGHLCGPQDFALIAKKPKPAVLQKPEPKAKPSPQPKPKQKQRPISAS